MPILSIPELAIHKKNIINEENKNYNSAANIKKYQQLVVIINAASNVDYS
jgi:hypothetical protein